MIIDPETKPAEIPNPEGGEQPKKSKQKGKTTALKAAFILVVFLSGLGSGLWIGRRSMPEGDPTAQMGSAGSHEAMIQQINPPEGYTIEAAFGDIGPQMLAAGAIDLNLFRKVYEQAGKPLTEEQTNILTQGSDSKVVINQRNAYFLLNFFWAFGLTNQNPILTEGPMMARGEENIGNFASTGGWTIGGRPPTELYASTMIVPLTEGQQARLLEVASAVYRPCCNNPTHFPDCNHGMAMLGLLELMASQGATTDEMFTAAKYVNAFWYPQQTLEIATALQIVQSVDFKEADARQVVSKKYSSGSGYQAIHEYLAANGALKEIPSSGGSCGVQ